jgi:Bacterial protein of unknown function (DUF885)
MQATSDAAIDALADRHFDIPAPVRRLECLIAPTEEGGIYYTPPTADLTTRPGRMWWSVPRGETRFSTWKERPTVYHEGVPGHHLQIAQKSCAMSSTATSAGPGRRPRTRSVSGTGCGCVRRPGPRRARRSTSGLSTARCWTSDRSVLTCCGTRSSTSDGRPGRRDRPGGRLPAKGPWPGLTCRDARAAAIRPGSS